MEHDDNDDVSAGGRGMELDEVARAYASQIPREKLEALYIATAEALVKDRASLTTARGLLGEASEWLGRRLSVFSAADLRRRINAFLEGK